MPAAHRQVHDVDEVVGTGELVSGLHLHRIDAAQGRSVAHAAVHLIAPGPDGAVALQGQLILLLAAVRPLLAALASSLEVWSAFSVLSPSRPVPPGPRTATGISLKI